MSNYSINFYNKKLPEIDDIVITKAIEIKADCVYVELLEYGNIVGMIGLKEISERRVRSIKKIITIGNIYPLLVINIDEDKGYIDLSNKYITEKDSALEKYNRYKIIYNMIYRISNELVMYPNNELNLEEINIKLNQKTIWTLKPDECYNIFSSIKETNSKINIFDIDEIEQELFLKYINKTLKDKQYIGKLIFKMNCYEISGLNSIKDVLQYSNENYSDSDIYLDTTPEYIIKKNSKSKTDLVDRINDIYKGIEKYAVSKKVNISKKVIELSNNIDSIIEKI